MRFTQSRKLFYENFNFNGFLSERLRFFYLATPKVACTNMKWWLMNIESISDSEIVKKNKKKLNNSEFSSYELSVHELIRNFSPLYPLLNFKHDHKKIESTNIFKFAIVRNPYARIFSAWQSKILLQEPEQIRQFNNKEFIAQEIENISDIRIAFEKFLEEIYFCKNLDVHWAPQHLLLRPDLIRYQLISKIEDTKELEFLLRNHLGKEYKSPFINMSYNKSLLPYNQKFISDKSAEIINSLYKKDFLLFNYQSKILRAKKDISNEGILSSIQAIKLIRMRHRIISDLRQSILNSNYKLSKSEEKLKLIEQELFHLKNSASWKLTKPLRILRKKVIK